MIPLPRIDSFIYQSIALDARIPNIYFISELTRAVKKYDPERLLTVYYFINLCTAISGIPTVDVFFHGIRRKPQEAQLLDGIYFPIKMNYSES